VHALVGVVSRQVQHADHAAKRGHEGHDGEDAEPGVDICVAMEDLTHRDDIRAARIYKSLPEFKPLQKQTPPMQHTPPGGTVRGHRRLMM
jgi:hypothetical protein